MLSREIENEFTLEESGMSIRSLIKAYELDISNHSSIVGISLYGSFEKIADEIKLNTPKNIMYHKIQKYINYIETNIDYLDLDKIDDSLVLIKFKKNNGKTYDQSSFSFVNDLFVLYFSGMCNDNAELQISSLNILSKIISKSLNCKTYVKFQTIISIMHNMWTHKGQSEYDYYTMWEHLFEHAFSMLILTNYNIFKKLNDVDKFDINEVINYEKSQIIKLFFSNEVKKSISQICDVSINKNCKLKSIYKINSSKLNNDINTLRKHGDFFASLLLTNFLETLYEY
jgi:hypothetical protein